MKCFTILGGVNGVGKSTFAGVLTNVTEGLGTLVDADKLAVRYKGSLEGGRQAVRLLDDCICRGEDLTWETTLSGSKTARTIAAAHENGYFVRLYYVALSSAGESLTRIANRVRKGGHNIPEDTVRRRFAKRFDDLARILPLVDEAVLFDNENGFVHVADYDHINGLLTETGAYCTKWLDELKERLK